MIMHVSTASRRRFHYWMMGVMEQGTHTPFDQEVCLRHRELADPGAEVVKLMRALLKQMGAETGALGHKTIQPGRPAPYQTVRYDREFFRDSRPPV